MVQPIMERCCGYKRSREVLQLIDKHFPRNSQFHKQFNRSTVKVSYSCMPNIANITSGHNKKVTGATDSPTKDGCNCRDGTDSVSSVESA